MIQDIIPPIIHPELSSAALFEALPGSCVLLKNDAPHYTVLAAAPEWLAQTGYQKEAILGKGIFEVSPANPDDPSDTGARDLRASLEMVRLHKQPHYLPIQRYDISEENGGFSERYWKAVNKPVFTPDGEVAYIVHTAEDITKQIKAERREEQIRGIEKAYTLFMQAPVAINILKGPELIIELANGPGLKIWGKEEDVIGQSLLKVVPELQGQGFKQLVAEIRRTGVAHHAYEQLVTLIRDEKPQDVYFNWVLQPVYDEEKKEAIGVIAFVNEVTEQVKARKIVSESESRFQTIANSLPIVIWTASPDGALTFISDQWESKYGNPIAESLGTGWAKFVHPDDVDRAAEAWRQSLQSGEEYETEFRVQHQEAEYSWQLVRAIPIRGDDGEIVQWYGSNTEIQENKLFEEQLEKRVKERTQEIEQFTYVSHHDLQEPLRKIMMFTGMVKSDGYEKLPEVSQKRLDRISDAAQRMSQALRDVLNFASLNVKDQFMELDLKEVVATVQIDLELAIQEKAAKIHAEELPVIKAIPGQMHQLFYNLIGNALKFSRSGQSPVITIKCRKLHAKETLNEQGLDQNKEYYEIAVQDHGIGFHQEAAEKIFTMFQRLHTKEAYAGTGIGLALCKKVVQNHEGKIWAQSTPGEGATFYVLLPAEA